MSDLASRISALSPEKRLLLGRLRNQEGRPEPAPALKPAERPRTEPFGLLSEEDRSKLPEGLEDAYPLTMVQLGMIYHMEMTPDASTPAYHNVNSFHLESPFDAASFQRAVDHIVAEHEVLRLSFALTGFSEPLQLIHRHARLEVRVFDLRHLSDDEQQRVIDGFIVAENRRLVDLSRPPLVRFHIHRRTDGTFQFTLTEPHAISDGWSTMSSLTDLFLLYQKLLRGEEPPREPPPSLTYRDFVALERQALASEEYRRFWSGKLEGYTLVPLPRWPASARTGQGGDRKPSIEVPSPVVEGIVRLREKLAVPFKNILLAAHLKVMSLLSGSGEVTTGLTTNGRLEEAGGDQVRGLFLNTLPLRFRVPDGTWADLARAAMAAELELMPFRRYPLAALQRLRGGQTLFESAFSYLHFHTVARLAGLGGISMRTQGNSDLSVTHFPLAVTFHRTPLVRSQLELTLEMNDPTLCEEQARAIQGYFLRVLEAMTSDPLARHDQQSFLSEKEQYQLLVQWNPSERDFRSGDTLHGLFERQAGRRPGAVAVHCGEERLTYGDLAARSYRLAQRLRHLGVGPEVLVGVCLERSPDLLVAIVATLKAGGAYVPLDPSYPQARLEFLIRDSGARVLLTHSGLELPEHGAEIVRLDEMDLEPGPGPEAPLPVVDPDHPAYVIYTSGSTGVPKGVVVTHANVARLLAATQAWFGFGESDVWTLFHSFAFDFSVWEIWGALAHGGRLVVVPYLVSRSPEAFYGLLRDEEVTVLNQTPSAFRQLIQAEEQEGGGELALRLVVFGGEALDPASLRPWLERHGDERPRLVNMYGITETTVHVTYRPVSRADLERGGSPIGRPIPDLRIFALDPFLQPVPVSVGGELHVAGAGLARGYLGRPELTAERFIPNPFGEPGSRLYRSGDLARFLPDGAVEYLGRIDHQVKIRGFRIELGEIETAIGEHPGVRQSAVLARQDAPGDARLVAYVVPRDAGAELAVTELRSFLQRRLPEHLIPSAFVQLSELPLTAHGKLDRRALPAPDLSRLELGQEFVAPRTPLEQKLAEAWAKALGVARVGIHDDYFALGGDSIRSIQVIARARERGIELSVPQLYRHTTVAELAAAVSQAGGAPGLVTRTEPFSLVSPEDRARLPEDVEDAYPLTRLQAGMLFHMDLAHEAPLYHNVESFHFQGRFEEEPFWEAVQRVVARHPVIRTSFHLATFSEPLQLVHREAVLPITVEDLRRLAPAEQEAAVDAYVDRERRRPFDLARAPQWRFHIQLRGEEDFQFTFTENHAIFDGWSLYSTLTEIFQQYQTLLRGEEPPEEPAPLPFREFVAAEREALRSEESRAYWLSTLGDATFLELPRWRPASVATAGGRNVHTINPPISRDTSEGLQRLALSARVPLKSVLMAVHVKVLARLTGQDDVLTGLVANGRSEEEGGEQTRGLFLNTVPFRLRLPGGSWTNLARSTFAAEQEMLPHRRYPLPDLQNEMGGRALFETVFNYTHFHVIQGVVQSGQLFVLDFRKSTETNFTLSIGFTLEPATQQMMLEVAGSARELPPEQVESIASWYVRASDVMVADPSARHDSASLLSPAEEQQMLAEWNDTGVDLLGEKLVHRLVEAQAARPPGRVAVEFEGRELTYAELDQRAGRLAGRLRRLGVGPDVKVAVCLDRSFEMVAALLAIWKAGGAYVPLDPSYPAERLAFLLDDARPAVLVTGPGAPGGLERPGLAVVDAREEDGEGAPAGLPAGDPDQLAYVIYTSGSTGVPKGVMVPHRAIANRLLWMQSAFPLGEGDAVLQKTPFGFDASIWELFLPLMAGARLVLARPGGHQDPAWIARAVAEQGVTVLQLVPSLLAVFLEEELTGCGSLRRLFCGGEALTPALRDRVFARLESVELCNLYGPTECAIDVTFWPCRRDGGRAEVPIGRPIANDRVYLLDQRLQPVPAGQAGELYAAGEGLARGYLGRPDLTAERFVPDPFSSAPGGRLYRTGDLARQGVDGAVEFLGRADDQVKLRGVRVELGEIETVLGQHPAVREAAVLVREDRPGDQRLVAYVASPEEARPAAEELRAFLEERLPEYMVPRAFVLLEALPLSPNGKIDRRALAKVEVAGETALEASYVAPRTPVEELLTGIFAELLRRDRVGVEDDFFALGGHSLLATQMVSRLREALSVELPLRSLFETPTVGGLARQIEDGLAAGAGVTAPAIVPAPREEPPPLSFAQERLWFLDRLQPGSATYNLPLPAALHGPLSARLLEAALAEVVRRHEALRTTFAERSGRPVQVIAPAARWSLPSVDLSALPAARSGAEVQRLIREEARRPFDLARGPLLRGVLVRLEEREHRLLLNMHHIVSDGWSMGVLVREVAAVYGSGRDGRPSPLPELPIQYADYAVSQREWLRGEVLETQLAYWREQLADVPVLELPTDRPRPPVQTFGGDSRPFQLPAELSRSLRALARRQNVTLFMALTAAYGALLSRLTGRGDDVLIGTPIAGRNRIEVEPLIGLFINTLVLRARVQDDPRTIELLARAREAVLGASAHQDIPFERLVDAVQPERDMSRNPLFQVMLVLQNAPAEAAEIPELSITPLPAGSGTAKFDLNLGMDEMPDGGLNGSLEYNTDLFDGTTVARMAGCFVTLIEGMVEEPRRPISDLPLLDAAARHQILAEWNDTRAPHRTSARTVHELFERQAAAAPERLAVVFGEDRLTYGELNRRANRLAHRLRALGAGPGELVGVHLPRSLDMVPALLGILKSGAGYLPLDVTLSADRLRWMLGSLGVRSVVTRNAQRPALAALASELPELGLPICLDDPAGLVAEREDDPAPAAGPEDVAYVIFTSGSTGRPKGVVVRHEPVLNLIEWAGGRFALGPDDRVLFTTALSFDLSVYDVFGLLAAGGSIHIASEADLREPERLVELLAREPVTFWDSAPAALSRLAPFFPPPGRAGTASRLRLVFLSGDWIPVTLPDQVRAAFPGARVVSLGGATEATVWSNVFPVEEVDPSWVSIPYGRPIANARYHVLDRHLRLCPIGVPGALYIVGGCLASGYAQDPALTAGKFLPDPFGETQGGVMYSTGDLARHLADGNLEFLGRMDFQVKIRGYRIELGEIETVLAQHPGVRAAVVTVREDQPGDRRLVAYAVLAGERAPEVSELREHLLERLPEYMLPAAFVILPELPVTANGKVDRKALPAPEQVRPDLEAAYVAPRTRSEELMAGLWAELLLVGRVGVHDNFFELGGHSMLAVQLVSRLRDEARIDVPLRMLFEAPTVAELAAEVERLWLEAPLGAGAALALPPVTPDPGHRFDPFPLTDLQQAYWIGRTEAFELGVAPITYQELEFGHVDLVMLSHAWRRLIDRHDALRMRVLPDGRQQVLPSVPEYRIQVLNLRGLPDEEVAAELEVVRRRMCEKGPDVEAWPPFELRATLLDESIRLHVALSLLICDARTVWVLNQELTRLYEDPQAVLPPLELSYRDYVLALAWLEETGAYERDLAYWRDRLAELPPGPELPLAKDAAAVSRSHFIHLEGRLRPEQWDRLRRRAARAGCTPTAVLATLYAEVFAGWSRHPRFTLDLLYLNRLPLHPQVPDLVANLSATLLLEVDGSRQGSFEERARRLQAQLWRDMDHALVSGVRVLREHSRLHGGGSRFAVPVVFASTLNVLPAEPERAEPPEAGEANRRSAAVYSHLQTPQVWVDGQVYEADGTLGFAWFVVEELFPDGMIDEMFAAWSRAVARLADEEEAWDGAAEPPWAPPAALALQEAVNATAAPLAPRRLEEPFADQASLRPEAPAVIAAGRTLTYGELAHRAGRLSRRLGRLGARPGSLVAVAMEKGWEQAVAALAVLEAGAAYLPVDPALPRARFRHLLEVGRVELALTQPWLAGALDWPGRVLPLVVGEDLEDPAGLEEPPAASGDAGALAYVLFTSGSTGLPKGVMIEHASAWNTVEDVNRRFGIGPEDRVLALSALSFDLSVYDLFGLLAAGGAVVMPDAVASREPALWADLLERERVTVWNSVPALMEMLVDHLEGRGEPLPASLRLVLLSGDWIPVSLPDRIRRLSPDVRVIGMGGATEASIWSILYPIGQVGPGWTSIPYGRPMANQTFHVLDADLRPRPLRVPGDLYIGGVGLARGYWGDEERTRASFLVHPETGERLYRTGDLGRWLPDGTIEFLGREDLQVKVQGFRIELGEVEAALLAHPAVRSGAAAAVGPQRGAKRLVVYVVPASGAELEVEELRGFLASKLPPYMVPSTVVVLDELPLTANGKVDRKALPDPEGARPGSGRPAVAPRDDAERTLARIWEEILEVPSVSVHDNFFELGGHSLLAVRLMARIQAAFGRELPLATLFTAATLERLADLLRQGEEGPARPLLVEIQAGGTKRPFFCVHPVGGNVLCYRELAQALGPDQPFYALQSPEADEEISLERLASAYIEAVRSMRAHGPYRLGGWSMGGTVAYEMARQLRKAGEEVELLALIDASAPDLDGPVEADDAVLASWFARDLGGLSGVELTVCPEELRALSREEQAARILDRALADGVLPPDFGAAELGRHLEMFQRNFRTLLAYRPGRYPGRLVLLDAAEGEGKGTESAERWRSLAEGADLHVVPGDHYTMIHSPHVEALGRFLGACLAGKEEAVTRT